MQRATHADPLEFDEPDEHGVRRTVASGLNIGSICDRATSYLRECCWINRLEPWTDWSSDYPKTIWATVSQIAVVTTAQAVAIVIWLEASACPVPNCVAMR